MGPSKKWIKGISDNEKVKDALVDPDWKGKWSGTIKESVYRLFIADYLKSWNTFASTKYYSRMDNNDPQKAEEWLSLEAIHNMIHVSHF